MTVHAMGLCNMQINCILYFFPLSPLSETWFICWSNRLESREEGLWGPNRIFSVCSCRKRFLDVTARCMDCLLACRSPVSQSFLLFAWPFGKYKQARLPRVSPTTLATPQFHFASFHVFHRLIDDG